jgi:hypothetical protein
MITFMTKQIKRKDDQLAITSQTRLLHPRKRELRTSRLANASLRGARIESIGIEENLELMPTRRVAFI